MQPEILKEPEKPGKPVTPPPGWDKTPEELGAFLCRWVASAEDARKDREERWRTLDAMYRCEPTQPSPPWTGAFQGHWNIVQEKIDQLQGRVVQTVTGQTPYCTASLAIDEQASEGQAQGGQDSPSMKAEAFREKSCQFFLEMAGYDSALRRLCVAAAVQSMGVLHVEYKPMDSANRLLPRLSLQVLTPTDVVAAPVNCEDASELLMIGHKFLTTKAQVEQNQRDGVWADVPVTQASEEDQDQYKSRASQTLHESPPDERLQQVELVAMSFRLPGQPWHEATVCPDTNSVLRCAPSKYKRPSYSVHLVKDRAPGDGFYSSTSPANDLQTCQLDANELWNLMMQAQEMFTFPPVFVKGTLLNHDDAKYAPGDIVEVEGDVVPVMVRPDLADLATAIEMVEAKAESVTRMSQQGAASEGQRDMTATQAGIIAQGEQQGTDAYAGLFSHGMEDTYALVDTVLDAEKDDWLPVFGKRLGATPEAVTSYATPALWEVSVKSSGMSPHSMVTMYQNLIALGGNPNTGIDQYAATSRALGYLERSGVQDAQEIQLPRDPRQLLAPFAAALGVPPELLAQAIPAGIHLVESQAGGAGVPGTPPEGPGAGAGGPGMRGAGGLPAAPGQVPGLP